MPALRPYLAVAAAGLFSLAVGCQGMPKAPGMAWSSPAPADDGVVAASYQEPTAPEDDPGVGRSISELEAE